MLDKSIGLESIYEGLGKTFHRKHTSWVALGSLMILRDHNFAD